MFGQTAIYLTLSTKEPRLQITVPLAPAKAQSEQGRYLFDDFANEKEPQAVNVYFPVTIKNVSTAATLDSSYLFTHATNRDQDESDVLNIVADGFEGTPSLGPRTSPRKERERQASPRARRCFDEVQLEISVMVSLTAPPTSE